MPTRFKISSPLDQPLPGSPAPTGGFSSLRRHWKSFWQCDAVALIAACATSRIFYSLGQVRNRDPLRSHHDSGGARRLSVSRWLRCRASSNRSAPPRSDRGSLVERSGCLTSLDHEGFDIRGVSIECARIPSRADRAANTVGSNGGWPGDVAFATCAGQKFVVML